MGDTGTYNILDEELVTRVKEYPTAELISLMFPGHNIGKGGLMCSPFRDEKKPSFSCFIGKDGISRWKDHAMNVGGDNIKLYQMAFPELRFIEAVDALSRLLFGKSAFIEASNSERHITVRRQVIHDDSPKPLKKCSEPRNRLVADYALDSKEIPVGYRTYWRNRGISDNVMKMFDIRYVLYENIDQKGSPVYDPISHLPVIVDGKQVVSDGLNSGLGMRNDIGGYAIREPQTDISDGWKGNVGNLFISTYLADRSRPASTVSYLGEGSNRVEAPCYNAERNLVYINRRQAFGGVKPYAWPFCFQVLDRFKNRVLDERDVRCICAVFSSLNTPISSKVIAVEGMFDGLSFDELNRMRRNLESGHDLIVLNSVTNVQWAVPFICRHEKAVIMLDNDQKSQAGQSAAKNLTEMIESFNKKIGHKCAVMDGSSLYEGFKDLNEALMHHKGFPSDYTPTGRTR